MIERFLNTPLKRINHPEICLKITKTEDYEERQDKLVLTMSWIVEPTETIQGKFFDWVAINNTQMKLTTLHTFEFISLT